ncbi:MAG: hypothetical protein KDA91_03095 [Planctomycetaceae bacterium]|nr:hypothetical protein [Planctomycetaceae bacterium]
MQLVLARYGSVPQVARFLFTAPFQQFCRGEAVIVTTNRGEELVQVLETTSTSEELETTGEVLRMATQEDIDRMEQLRSNAEQQFIEWSQRIRDWGVQLELIDTEWTLSDRLILYVLNGRDAETTRLALLAAANGFGIVHVQPVNADGIIPLETKSGCGTGGYGKGGCGCKH